MSASLVGSEMCIRDSSCAAQGVGRGTAFMSYPPPFPALSMWLGGTRPVSYTHLTLPTICSV
eukprot:8673479-Alexandrium_andersonii.AAC.1